MLRPVTPADAPTIALHRYPEEADAAERPIYAGWVAGAIECGNYQGFLYERGGAVVCGAGLVLLEWGPSRAHPTPFLMRLSNVWTHPDHRREGLARQVVTACLNLARENGVQVVNLSTSVMARDLYASLGFVASATEMRCDLG